MTCMHGGDTPPCTALRTLHHWKVALLYRLFQGHRIPVLPKPLSQMKTTETRSYLSRLIWATNGWKRPQYGNPDTKPVWWPNELLNWAEMKKMGGKKADGLSNVNYNEIQKTILHEVCLGFQNWIDDFKSAYEKNQLCRATNTLALIRKLCVTWRRKQRPRLHLWTLRWSWAWLHTLRNQSRWSRTMTTLLCLARNRGIKEKGKLAYTKKIWCIT